MSKTGTLYLIPAPLADAPMNLVIPEGVKERIHHITHFMVEKEKPARAYLKKLSLENPLQEITLFNIGKYSEQRDYGKYLDIVLKGEDMGLLSDAGCPGIADPGALLIDKAHQLGISVVPFVGPSSILLGMMASGMNGQNFAFQGYLPIDSKARNRKIQELETLSSKTGQAQLFIETPYRNASLYESLLKSCRAGTRLCLAVNVTGSNALIKTQRIAEWKTDKHPRLQKQPCVFILQA